MVGATKITRHWQKSTEMFQELSQSSNHADYSSTAIAYVVPMAARLGGRWVLLIVRGSNTTLPFGVFSDYVIFSSRVKIPALVFGLSS